jgi:hypothetical protein
MDLHIGTEFLAVTYCLVPSFPQGEILWCPHEPLMLGVLWV